MRIANRESKSSMECTQDAMTKSAGRNRRDRERQPEILRLPSVRLNVTWEKESTKRQES